MTQTAEQLSEWLGQLVDGSTGAYESLYRSLHAPILRYVRQITRDEAVAYDVLQDVFMKLWDRRESLDRGGSIRALLFTMAKNRALSLARRSARMSPLTEIHTQNLAGQEEDPTEATDLAHRLKTWIDGLPTRRREAFLLSRNHGLSHREVGAVMGVSEKTVDTHILLVLKDLRQRVDQYRAQLNT